MNITQLLYLYPEIESKISQLRKEIVTICEDKYSIRITPLANTPVHGGISGGICETIISCEAQIRDKQKRIDEMIDVKRELENCFDQLPVVDMDIITLRYFSKSSWPEICERTGISVNRLYRRATEIKNKIAVMYKNTRNRT